MVPATFALMQRVGWRSERGDRVAALAAILAHVREDDTQLIARAIGHEAFGKPRHRMLSENRFRRLMQVQDADELMTGMTRLVAWMGGKANVSDLARSVLFWTEQTRARWAYGYYGAGIANPDNANEVSHG
jgi:CRISPR system Cascade subunit CasB